MGEQRKKISVDMVRAAIGPIADDEKESDCLMRDADAGGWVTNGHFAAFVGDDLPRLGTRPMRVGGSLAGLLRDLLQRPRHPFAEALDQRIPRTWREFSCDGCQCGACPGGNFAGRMEVAVPGQAVFRGDGGVIVVLHPDYTAMFAGLEVFRCGAVEDVMSPLCGFDGENLVVVVMPQNRKPDPVPAQTSIDLAKVVSS